MIPFFHFRQFLVIIIQAISFISACLYLASPIHIFHNVLGRQQEHDLSGQSSIFFICALEEVTKYEYFNLYEPGVRCGVLAQEMLENINKSDLKEFLD